MLLPFCHWHSIQAITQLQGKHENHKVCECTCMLTLRDIKLISKAHLIDSRGFKMSWQLLEFDKMYLVALVKIITFWPTMNFSQSFAFAESDAYFNKF